MKCASLEAKNATPLAISKGSATLLSGMLSINLRNTSSGIKDSNFFKAGVSTAPGLVKYCLLKICH